MKPINIFILMAALCSFLSALFNIQEEFAFSAACGWFCVILSILIEEKNV